MLQTLDSETKAITAGAFTVINSPPIKRGRLTAISVATHPDITTPDVSSLDLVLKDGQGNALYLLSTVPTSTRPIVWAGDILIDRDDYFIMARLTCHKDTTTKLVFTVCLQ